MKNMLEMPIELEPTGGNCYDAYCTKAPAIPGHSQYITALLNECIKNIGKIDQKDIENIVKYLFDLGLARDFVIEVWQKRYYGNIGLGKALTLSYTCGRCLNTNGLFVVVNGPAGFGKSAGMKTMLDLMPPEFVKQGKESAQAMYYDDMAPGTIRYIDEIKFDNDIKEAWTYFQSRTSFVKRLWLSCVDKGDEIR